MHSDFGLDLHRSRSQGHILFHMVDYVGSNAIVYPMQNPKLQKLKLLPHLFYKISLALIALCYAHMACTISSP